jgi:hypothetical protein
VAEEAEEAGAVTEHAGREYLDACFGVQEQRRLAYVEEAKRTPGSWWYENERRSRSRDEATGVSDASPEGHGEAVEPSGKPGRVRTGPGLSRTCGCCGRVFWPRRRDAVFCRQACQKRSRRGRCEKEAA